jgi:hypothetical protein
MAVINLLTTFGIGKCWKMRLLPLYPVAIPRKNTYLKTSLSKTYVKFKGGVKQTISLFCEYGFC